MRQKTLEMCAIDNFLYNISSISLIIHNQLLDALKSTTDLHLICVRGFDQKKQVPEIDVFFP